MPNEINKLRIVSLAKLSSQFKGSALNIAKAVAENATSRVFEAQINPENITRNFKINYTDPAEAGKTPEKQYFNVEPEVLNLKFILDGTGIVDNSAVPLDGITLINEATNGGINDLYVTLKVAQLQATVYNIQDESHRPPFVLVTYGKLVFYGILEELATNYTLFNAFGFPLRAEIDLKIKSQIDDAEAVAIMSLLSPDLTRQHTVLAGENILRICEEYYEDERYYIEVARENNLVNFRNIKPAEVLTIPPIDKSSI